MTTPRAGSATLDSLTAALVFVLDPRRLCLAPRFLGNHRRLAAAQARMVVDEDGLLARVADPTWPSWNHLARAGAGASSCRRAGQRGQPSAPSQQ